MSQQTRVPRPDADAETVLGFYAQRDGQIIIGPCAQFHDDGGRCTGTLSVEDETLVDEGDMVTLGCDKCDVMSFRTTEFVLRRARSNLADYHYNAQLGEEGQQ